MIISKGPIFSIILVSAVFIIMNCHTVVKMPAPNTQENHYVVLKPKEPKKSSDTVKVSSIRYAPEIESQIMLQYYFYYKPENAKELRITSLTRITFEGSYNRYYVEGKIFRLKEREYLSKESLEEIERLFLEVNYLETPQYRILPPKYWPDTGSGLVLSYREEKGDKFKHLYLEEPLDARYKKRGYDVLLRKLMTIVKEPRYKDTYLY